MGIEPVAFPAPDGTHTVRLAYLGEVRFGPAYYEASLDEREIRGVFGGGCLWSADGRFAALQAWNKTAVQDGPDTSLYLIRLDGPEFYDRARCRGGWIRPESFQDGKIVFARDTRTRTGTIEEVEIALDEIRDWTPLFPPRRLP